MVTKRPPRLASGRCRTRAAATRRAGRKGIVYGLCDRVGGPITAYGWIRDWTTEVQRAAS